MYDYFEVAIKIIVTVLLLLVYVKISGKSQLAPMSAFDQVGNMIIGAIGGTTLLNQDVSVFDSSIFMIIWVGILLLIRYLKFRSLKIKEIVDGKRIELLKDGKMIPDNFKKVNISVRDIETLVHSEGVLGIFEIKNLWFEPNREISYDKKGEEGLSLLVIEEGKVNEEVLNNIGKDCDWLEAEVQKNSISDIKNIFCAEWVGDKLYIYLYDSENK